MKISVCLASYNGEKFIREQLKSILACLSDVDEIIISDDGSTDNTVSIINSFKDKRMTLYSNQGEKGIVSNFKNAVSHATGDIIVLSDQDDLWLPNRIESLNDIHKNYGLVMCNGNICDHKLNQENKTIQDIYPPSSSMLHVILKNCFVGCAISFTQPYKKIFLSIPDKAPMHDWAIGLFATQKKDVFFDKVVRFLYRRHNDNNSSTGVRSKRSIFIKISDRTLILKALLKMRKI